MSEQHEVQKFNWHSYQSLYKLLSCFWVLFFGVFTSICTVAAQVVQPEEEETWAWINREWTSQRDDRSFKIIRSDVDLKVRVSKDNQKLINAYKKDGAKQHATLKDVYRWAYAAWISKSKANSYAERDRLLDEPKEALGRFPQAKSYEVIRLRFLMEGYNMLLPRLVPLGERLLKRDPADYDVKRVYISLVNTSAVPISTRKKLVVMSNELIRQKPISDSYATLGSVYLYLWQRTKNRVYGQKAIDAYQKYLQLSPKEYFWNEQAKYLINNIKQQMKANSR